MRKEVKIGFAIGGLAFAAVLVWVLSLGGSKSKPLVASATNGKAADATSITPSADSLNNDQPQLANSAGQQQARGGAQPTTVPTGAQQNATANALQADGDLDWDKLLNGSQQIPLMTQTAAAPPSRASVPLTQADGTAQVSDTLDSATPARPVANAVTTVKPLKTGPRSHQIQPGETLSSIAMAAYGSPNLYPAILRANPKLDPRRLKPGTNIVLPDVSEISSRNGEASGAQSAATAVQAESATINSSREYKVQPGDSLYRISVKLYGTSRMQEKIYELNRTTIGPNKERIRVGMVLKLPSAPTATSSAH